jgi:predicted CoA-binding protein
MLDQGEIEETRERILARLDEIEKEINSHSGFGVTVDGKIAYFSCHCDPDNPDYYEAEYLLDYLVHLRRMEPLHDPNRIDSRRVRKELKDSERKLTIVNLGDRVNRVPSNAVRI